MKHTRLLNCCLAVPDTTFRQQADYLNSSGMAAAGYRTMIIQECITLAGHRDANGVPQPDPKKFPYGIKGLCDYIHSKGLLCGIYTDVGPKTCAGWEGSFNHDEIDAKTYAEWCACQCNHVSQRSLPRRGATGRLVHVAPWASCLAGRLVGRYASPRLTACPHAHAGASTLWRRTRATTQRPPRIRTRRMDSPFRTLNCTVECGMHLTRLGVPLSSTCVSKAKRTCKNGGQRPGICGAPQAISADRGTRPGAESFATFTAIHATRTRRWWGRGKTQTVRVSSIALGCAAGNADILAERRVSTALVYLDLPALSMRSVAQQHWVIMLLTHVGCACLRTVLEVGMEGLTELEWRTHFSLWAMAAAPLWVGIDMTKMPAAALQIFCELPVSTQQTAQVIVVHSSSFHLPLTVPAMLGASCQ